MQWKGRFLEENDTEVAKVLLPDIPPAALPAVKESFAKQVPLGRMGTSEEVARWVVAIADPRTTWVTGQVLSVDGGMSLT